MTLAAAHRDHDFYLVAIGQRGRAMLAFGHDVAIGFHGDAFILIAQKSNQFRNGIHLLELLGVAVKGNVHVLSPYHLLNLSVAAMSRLSMPGSSKAWPASSTRWNSAWGQALCNSQAVFAGVQAS